MGKKKKPATAQNFAVPVPSGLPTPFNLFERKIRLKNTSGKDVYATLARGDWGEGNPGWFKVLKGDTETWRRFAGSSDMRFIVSKTDRAADAYRNGEAEVTVDVNGGWNITWDGHKLLKTSN